MPELDFNSDLGESFGLYHLGNDEAVLPFITSANVACGFHAGDAHTMRKTVALAAELGVAVGAHPGLPDLQGFGRRVMAITPDEAYEFVLYQVGALKGFTAAAGVALHHVKAHGALYNMAATNKRLADAICQAVKDIDPALVLFGLANSALTDAAQGLGLAVAHEVFADRTYQQDGTLTPRSQPGAMITDIGPAIEQVLSMVCEGYAVSMQGTRVPVTPGTLCIHGDQPGAAGFARAIREALEREGVTIRRPRP
ncbi:5-oxoprolinase subunit PxpA [Pseudomonas sp. CCC3.1]|uniref:LamB/YcsF family protein n=1 Tax=Pseudomonas sp. CCC3.1 TaxID=3048607 RepID=UPI002AC976A2|nr:5-oxoprolinase subunit PxpA [Pseudomonas sp. CCC3.1]MEB0205418.1 5-oxoprolinase subunit PxpA [Pseudomonas sp. CCC3.1]WPX36086.1 5-oxoprolinase subunit PxpA [Pseudomonas sp. CCC3.1]